MSDILSTIFKFFFFFIVGSLISFFADNLAKRVGKKKISFFNIRPRYTAVIITSITGGLIAVLSILFLSFLSRDARIYLFQMNQITKQLDFYRNEVKSLQDKFIELSRDVSILIQTTHMGDIIFVKNQPIFIYSFFNSGNKSILSDVIKNANSYIRKYYKIKELYDVIRINKENIYEIYNQIDEKKNKRLAMMLVANRNIFLGEYIDVNVYIIEDRLILPAGEVLAQVDIKDPNDVETNFSLVLEVISQLKENLIKKGKLFLPQENSIGGEVSLSEIIGKIDEIKEKSNLTNNKKNFKILLINKDDIYVANKFNILLKIVEY
jgi:hypothetical protein